MSLPLRLAAAALAAGGLLWASQIAVGLADGRPSVAVFLSGVALAAVSLPVVVRFGARSGRLAVAGTLVVLAALALVPLFNVGLVLEIADRFGFWVQEAAMEAGRKAILVLHGAGLAALAVAWNGRHGDFPVRVALLGVGIGGVVVALTVEGRPYGVWYLAVGALWVFLGLAALLDSREPAST